MSNLLKTLLYFFTGIILLSSCKKTENASVGTFSADDYVFNRATKSFTPNADVTAKITSSGGIRYIYAYLIRSNANDSLIAVASPDNATDYTFSIPKANFPVNNLSKVKGIKVLAKQVDNSTVEGFIKVTYFDPALPQLKNFPTTLKADINGGKTNITGNITSDYGLAQVDVYDDYQTENTFVLVKSTTGLNGAKTYAFNYDYIYRKASQHIKIVAKDIYGQSAELVIAMPVDVTLFKPKFIGFPTTVTPSLTAATVITGNITTVTGLKRIDVYDDYQGAYALVSSVNNLNASLNYSLNYSYTYRKRAANLKIVAIDIEDVQSEIIIPLNISYSSVLYRDVVMNAQTTGTNTIFIGDGTTLGNCSLNASEGTMAFLYYGTSTGPAFYSPTNTASVATNFKCNGTSWTIANSGSLRATRFRVLVPGTSTGIDNVYTQYNANNIDVIDDAFFTTANGIAAPAGSSAKFDSTTAATTAIFNTTGAYLIYIRIPDANGTTYKNALMRVKEATSTTGTSTVKFDIYIQK